MPLVRLPVRYERNARAGLPDLPDEAELRRADMPELRLLPATDDADGGGSPPPGRVGAGALSPGGGGRGPEAGPLAGPEAHVVGPCSGGKREISRHRGPPGRDVHPPGGGVSGPPAAAGRRGARGRDDAGHRPRPGRADLGGAARGAGEHREDVGGPLPALGASQCLSRQPRRGGREFPQISRIPKVRRLVNRGFPVAGKSGAG